MVISKFIAYFLEKETQDLIDNKEYLKLASTKEIVIPFKDGEKSYYVNYSRYKESCDLLYPKKSAMIPVEVEIGTISTGGLGLTVRHPNVYSDIDLNEVEHFYIIDNGRKIRHDLKEHYKEKLSEIVQRVDTYLLKETVFKLNEDNIRKLQQFNKMVLKENQNGSTNVH